jgi:hypothetical protein
MKHLNMMIVTAGLMLISLPVLAEEIIITHRSGKVQIIQVDSSIDPVESVTLRRSGENTLPAMPPPSAQLPPRTTATPPPEPPTLEGTVIPKTQDEANVSGKPSIKYKWAQPLDPQ